MSLANQLRILLTAALPGAVSAQPAAPDASDDSLPDLRIIGKRVAEIRQLEFLVEVPAERQSQEDFAMVLEQDLDEAFPPNRRADMLRGLHRLGIIREEIDLGDGFRDALLTQAGAYYDPDSGKFFYLMDAAGIPGGMDIIAAHELVHALQDQHYDLNAILEPFEAAPEDEPRNDDGILAVRSVVEGDATYVMLLFQFAQMGVDLSDPDREQAMVKTVAGQTIEMIAAAAKMQAEVGGFDANGDIAKAIAAMDQIPPYLLEPLYAAYFKGALFCTSLKQAEGWDGVGRALSRPPRSMEQVLHPQKHHGGPDELDEPTRIRLPEMPWLAEAGFNELDSAVLGEFYIGLLLRMLGVGMLDQIASQGWDGDVYAAFGRGDETLVVVATTWDTASDAREFFDVYRSALRSKYTELEQGEVIDAREGLRLSFDCGGGLGKGVLMLRDREVFLVEGGSESFVDRILRDLVAMPIEHVD